MSRIGFVAILLALVIPFVLPQSHQVPCSSFQNIDENFLRANQAKLISDPNAFYAVDMMGDCNLHYIDFATLGPPKNKDSSKFNSPRFNALNVIYI